MSFIKKITCFLFAVMLFVVVVGSNFIFANDNYPLENGEKLIDERVIDKGHADIYTLLDNDFYLKKLEKNEEKWVVKKSQIITLKPTGLNAKVSNIKGDRQLANSLNAKLKSFGVEPTSLPPVVDFSQSQYLPPVGEQFENSCVGWAAGYYLRTYQQAKDIGWQVKQATNGVNSHIFSPTFIYNQINMGVDNGAEISDAANLLKTVGDATLESFPYIPRDYHTKPTQYVIQGAYPNRIQEWKPLYTAADSDDYIIQETKKYLNTGDLVVAGSKVGFLFMYPTILGNGESIITTENSVPYKHAFVIVGYDDNFLSSDGYGAFKLINSWGKDWGNQGFSYISYSDFSANALEGYVFTDLVNSTQTNLNTEINNSVVFNVEFCGTGRFDIKIKSENNELIYQENNLQGTQGLNTFTWNGKDSAGNSAIDSPYKLSIIPYKNDTPKPPFDMTFNKLGKIESASSHSHLYDNVINYVDIPITFKADGILDIKISYNETEYNIITDEAVKAGESKVYTIQNSEFDFNNKNLDQVRIKINVR